MTEHLLRCSQENCSVSHKWADNIVEDDIAAVVDVGGSKTPEEQENLEEAPEGDKMWVL